MAETPRPVVLIDLSSILYPLYMTSQSHPDPEHAAHATVARVHDLSRGEGDVRVAVCCDGGKSFRHDLDPSYKATRKDKDAALIHQLRLAQDTLRGDGFAVWHAPGFEADDLLASAVAQLPAGTPITVATGDKDLLALVGGSVVVKSVRDGTMLDAEGVFNKLGVVPSQMTDYLCLVGDTSDNVKGANGIGPKKAAELLARFGTLDAYYAEVKGHVAVAGVPPSVVASLVEFEPRLPLVRRLIQLRTDAPVPIEDLDAPRTSPPLEAPDMSYDTQTPSMLDLVAEPAPAEVALPAPVDAQQPAPTNGTPPEPRALVVQPAAAPAEWERHLEPRSMNEAIALAKYVNDSRLFTAAYGNAQAVLSTVLAGRELGLQAMASLRAIHIVEGKPTLSADLIRAMVLRSGLATYFRCTERTAERATFETQRGDDPPMALTFTIEEARAAWSGTDDKWSKSAWGHNPADMLVARAGAKLARLVYPDVVHGLYTPEEIEAS